MEKVFSREEEGFSLIEMIIAMAVTSILLLGLVAIMSYGTRSMRITQSRVELQNQAKDVVNHISTYTMEGDTAAKWYSSDNCLLITKKNVKVDATPAPLATNEEKYKRVIESRDACVYWFNNKKIYFKRMKEGDSTFLGHYDPKADDPFATFKADEVSGLTDEEYVLAENVESFDCSFLTNFNSSTEVVNAMDASNTKSLDGKVVLKVDLSMKSEFATFDLSKDIMLRNQ